MSDFTPESLAGLSQEDKYAAADKFAGVVPGTFRGLHGAESGFGQSLLSPAGAEGDYQVMPNTRAVLEKRVGRKFDPYNHDHSLAMAAMLMRENRAHFGNDADALTAYNAGWDESRWGATPESAEYVSRVSKFGGVKYAPGKARNRAAKARLVPDQGVGPTTVDGTVEGSQATMPRDHHVVVTGGATGSATGAATEAGTVPEFKPQEGKPADIGSAVAAGQPEAQPEASFLAMTGAAFHKSLIGQALAFADSGPRKVDPTFKPLTLDDQRLAGLTDDEAAHIVANAYSEDDVIRLRREADNDRAMAEGTKDRSILAHLGAGALGSPEYLLLSGGASLLLRSEGLAATVAREAGANVVGGALNRAAAGEKTTAENFAEDVAMGALPVAGMHAAGAAFRALRKPALEAAPTPHTAEVQEAEAQVRALVDSRVGPDAAPEVRAQAAAEVRADEVRKLVVPAERRMLTEDVHDPDNFAEAATAAEPAAAAPADTPAMSDFPTLDFNFEVPKELRTVEVDPSRYADPEYKGELLRQAAAGKFDEFTTTHFGDTFSGILDKIEGKSGVITLDGFPAAKSVQTFMQDNMHLLPDGHRVVLTTKPALDKVTGKVRGGTIATLGDTHFIYVNGGQTLNDMTHASVHEFGHAVYHSWAGRIPKDMHAALMGDFAKFRKLVEEGDVDARTAHGAASSPNVVLDGTLRDSPLPKRGADNGGWFADHNEYVAEQFVKSVLAKHKAVNDGAVATTMAKAVAAFRELLDKVGSLFTKAKAAKALAPDTSYADFLDAVHSGRLKAAQPAMERAGSAGHGPRTMAVADMVTEPTARAQRATIIERVLQCLTSQ